LLIVHVYVVFSCLLFLAMVIVAFSFLLLLLIFSKKSVKK
jgi:hypothetical protein